jgi:transposase
MSLHPKTCPEVPASTAAVARAAFPRGNPYLRLRDALGTVFSDAQFAPLFPSRGQPAETPWRLALVTVLQFAENLSDRRAAEAVRGRIDWNICSAWSWPTRALTPRGSASSERGS